MEQILSGSIGVSCLMNTALNSGTFLTFPKAAAPRYPQKQAKIYCSYVEYLNKL